MDRGLWARRTGSECVRGPGNKLGLNEILADLKILNFVFHPPRHNWQLPLLTCLTWKVEYCIDRELWAKRTPSECVRRPGNKLGLNQIFEILTILNFDSDPPRHNWRLPLLTCLTQKVEYCMDRGLWAKRTGSECVRGPGNKLGLNQIFEILKILNFDFNPPEAQLATFTFDLFDLKSRILYR